MKTKSINDHYFVLTPRKSLADALKKSARLADRVHDASYVGYIDA